MAARTYTVKTWDLEKQKFTRQKGMKHPWHGLNVTQLRAACRELRSMGYGCYLERDYDGTFCTADPCVLVEPE